MSREIQASIERKLTREERKSLRIADFRDCTPERRIQLRELATLAINNLVIQQSIQKQRSLHDRYAIVPTNNMLLRNTDEYVLTLECLDEIDSLTQSR